MRSDSRFLISDTSGGNSAGRLAHSVERVAVNRKVVGSTPTMTVLAFCEQLPFLCKKGKVE